MKYRAEAKQRENSPVTNWQKIQDKCYYRITSIIRLDNN